MATTSDKKHRLFFLKIINEMLLFSSGGLIVFVILATPGLANPMGNNVVKGTTTITTPATNTVQIYKITANGRKILMAARTAGEVIDHSINMSGIAVAKSVGMHNGEIVFGAEKGNVVVREKVNASGKKTRETSSKIKISANQIVIADDAIISARGDKKAERFNCGDYQEECECVQVKII